LHKKYAGGSEGEARTTGNWKGGIVMLNSELFAVLRIAQDVGECWGFGTIWSGLQRTVTVRKYLFAVFVNATIYRVRMLR